MPVKRTEERNCVDVTFGARLGLDRRREERCMRQAIGVTRDRKKRRKKRKKCVMCRCVCRLCLCGCQFGLLFLLSSASHPILASCAASPASPFASHRSNPLLYVLPAFRRFSLHNEKRESSCPDFDMCEERHTMCVPFFPLADTDSATTIAANGSGEGDVDNSDFGVCCAKTTHSFQTGVM